MTCWAGRVRFWLLQLEVGMEIEGSHCAPSSIVPDKPGLEVTVAQLLILKFLAANGDALVQECLVELLSHCWGVTGNYQSIAQTW